MRFYEHEAKQVLARFGIEVPRGAVAGSPEQARYEARRLGGEVVVKGQVLAGGRMKAGLVRFASSPEEAGDAARAILAREVDGRLPAAVLVEELVPVAREYYAGIAFDSRARRPVAIVSVAGGIDVEEADAASRGRVELSTHLPSQNFRLKECLAALGVTGRDLVDLTVVLSRLHRAAQELDLLLAEINPLASTADGRWFALDCHIDLDDDAVFRQSSILRDLGIDAATRGSHDPTPLELEAARIDRSDHRGVAGRVVEFDGNLGLLIGGGGASLTAFDAIRRYGGRPANYSEIGGNPSVRKVAALTELLLSRPGVERIAVIMNVVNNTRADLIARGVIKGCIAAGRPPAEAIAVFRVPGAWEAEAERLLDAYGVRHCDRAVSIDEAAAMAVEAAGGA
ncbi:MAG: ADP-forming succinate--CoA ligase subunit beta [Dehalococcoidia bacterium]